MIMRLPEPHNILSSICATSQTQKRGRAHPLRRGEVFPLPGSGFLVGNVAVYGRRAFGMGTKEHAHLAFIIQIVARFFQQAVGFCG